MGEATKNCPMCGEEILAVALKCRYCGEYFDDTLRRASAPSLGDRMLLPVGRPGSAIASGYLGLTAFFPLIGLFLGILAIIFGIKALKQIKKDPSLSGKGRAWFGIIAGGFWTLIQIFGWIALIVEMINESQRR